MCNSKVVMSALSEEQTLNYCILSKVNGTATAMLTEGSRIGRSKTYRLNPQFIRKGTASDNKRALKNGPSVIQGGKV
ncbi:Uncharacterised protein [Klebsiella pneumoniae]|jgi:hypothetical protein|nr:hypothetical protein [Klebsiella pneumoniae]QBP27492.1 hypothetical protein [Klebsiella phage ST13-OXA48phi12.3]MBA0113377.1 hypothetical protein [Klebsiella pneumoniae]MBK2714678.1 hypothetical protein [Klebsiella pneumoniae]MBK3307616.1 hypothetical protein [Klebsiella pneumoniae]